MKSVRAVLLTAAAFVAAGSASAQSRDNAFTVYAAYRDGGSFTDVTSGNKLDIEASGAVSASLDLRLDARSQVQIFLSRQNSRVDTAQAIAVTPPGGPVPAKVPLKITYLHVGGTAFLEGKIGQGPYLVGGLGATLFEPGGAFQNELRPSLNLGVGYQLPLGEWLALRFEARGYATLVNSSGGIFCSGGCVVSIKGDTVTQGDVQLGLSVRY